MSQPNQPGEETRSGSDVETPVSGSSQNTSNDSQGSSDVPVQSSSEAIPLSTSSSIPTLTERACSVAADVPPVNTLQSPSVVSDQLGLTNKKMNEMRLNTATAQTPNIFLSSQPPIPTSIVHAMMSSPPTNSSTPIPTPAMPLAPSTSSQIDAFLAANRLPFAPPAVPVAQQQALPLMYPHGTGTAGEAYQSYLAAMARKKQEEQTAKQIEAVLPGVGLDVKNIIQQASASHGLPTPVAVTTQWMHSPAMCVPSTPTPYLPPFQPPAYTLSGLAPQYPYTLTTNDPSLQSPPSLPQQANEAQILAALMAATPSPSHLFNVNSWPALGMGPYIFQQMLANLITHQAAASSPSLHGLAPDMSYPALIQMQQPVTSSVTPSESPGVKKDNDSSRSVPKIAARTTSK